MEIVEVEGAIETEFEAAPAALLFVPLLLAAGGRAERL